jgi:FAD/FMN-containing dehydrogenase
VSTTSFVSALKAMQQRPDAAQAAALFQMLRDEPTLTQQATPLLEQEPLFAPALRVERPGELYRHHNVLMPRPRDTPQPRSLNELLELVRQAALAQRTLKAMGDGWGFSNAVFTPDWLVHCVELDDVLPLEAELLGASAPPASELVRVQAGITFEKLNTELAKTGRTVLNQPGFQKLTYVGCAAAGGHGSGLALGGIASQVEAVELVTLNDQNQPRLVRVERTAGLSDPAKWRARYPGPTFDLVQDDGLFHAARCGVGFLGVVYAVVTRTQPAYRLRETRTLTTWSAALPQVRALLADADVHSLHLWLNPYLSSGQTDQTCALTVLRRTTAPLGGRRGVGILLGGMNPFTELVRLLVSVAPEAIPFLMDRALESVVAADVVMPSTEALDFGAPNTFPVHAASVGFDAAQLSTVMPDVMARLREWARQGNWVSSPIGLRWVRASEDWLSPQFGRDTCMLEVPIMQGTPNAQATLDRYAAYMMDTWGGRPHWGQQNPMNRAQLLKSYGPAAVASFVSAYRTLNPRGFFDGPLTQQLGLRELASGP